MKTLIADDDFANRVLMRAVMKGYGATHVAVNGVEAVAAVRTLLRSARNATN